MVADAVSFMGEGRNRTFLRPFLGVRYHLFELTQALLATTRSPLATTRLSTVLDTVESRKLCFESSPATKPPLLVLADCDNSNRIRRFVKLMPVDLQAK